MIVFRLSKSKFANDLSGKGAEKSGGRWNSRGIAMVYTSESRALCTTEIAVHTPLGNLPPDYCIVTIEIPESAPLQVLNLNELPSDWNTIPHSHSTQEIGEEFITEEKFLVLKVPSVVVHGDFNYLLNPKHPQFNDVKIKSIDPFNFDKRLFNR
jgi:RES domain-containing protein